MNRRCYFVDLLYDLVFIAEIYCSWITLAGPEINKTTNQSHGQTELTSTVNDMQLHTVNKNLTTSFTSIAEEVTSSSKTTKMNIIQMEETLKKLSEMNNNTESLVYIEELTDQVTTSMQKQFNDVYFSSFIAKADENNKNDVIWKKTKAGYETLEVTLFNEAVRNLRPHSSIKMMLIQRTQELLWENKEGPLIVVKTESVETIHYESEILLQIKINKTEYLHHPNENWICVYRDYKNNSWRTDGLTTSSDFDFVKCESNHLSVFSVLLDPYSLFHKHDLNPLECEHELILTTISVIGSLVTVPCLVLIVGVYYRKQSDSETTKILINSCIMLLLTHFSYQIYTWFDDFINCLLINVMSHYSVLSFLLWTACDGINMWRILFMDVFNTKGYVFYHWYKVISWGIPFISIAIGALVTDNHQIEKCELHFDKTFEIIFYITPCTLILCCNVLLFSWMLIKVTCRNSLGRLKNKKLDYVVALTQVFGIGWCVSVPLLWFHPTHLIGQYLFAILVSTQGAFIFMVRCYNDANLRKRILAGDCLKKISVSDRMYTMTDSYRNRSSTTVCHSPGTSDTSGSEKENAGFRFSFKN